MDENKKKKARSLYKILYRLKEKCNEIKDNDKKGILCSNVDQFHSFLDHYERELDDKTLSLFKVPESASMSVTGPTRYFFLDQLEMRINQVLDHLVSNYDIDVCMEIGLIEDNELRNRCIKLFNLNENFDTIVREATTILENRVRVISNLEIEKTENLINRVFNTENGILIIDEDQRIQQGFCKLCSGVYQLYRQKPHHKLLHDLKRKDAIKIVLIIDEILLIINKSKKNEPTTTTSPNQSF